MTKQFWLDSAWHSPWATTKALIRTHNRWLTVFGAAIVFALFIVKDAYRESAKEMASLLSQAQSTFINGRNIHLIQSQLAVMDTMLFNIREKVSEKGKPEPSPEREEYGITETYDYVDAQVMDLNKLLDIMPWDKADRTRVDTLRTTNDKLRKEHENSLKQKKPVDIETSEGLAESMTPLFLASVDELMIEVTSKGVLLNAEREQQRRERIVNRLTKAGYVLYPLGILIALVAKLYGDGEGPDL